MAFKTITVIRGAVKKKRALIVGFLFFVGVSFSREISFSSTAVAGGRFPRRHTRPMINDRPGERAHGSIRRFDEDG